MKLFQGKGFQVIYSKESEELQLAIDFLSQVRRHLRVEYKDRRAFLTPFVHLLADPGKKHGMKGVSRLARTLYLLVDFMDADGGTNTLNARCIESDLYRLYNELYPEA